MIKLTHTRYKLVTQDYTSYNGTPWRDAAGKWLSVEATGHGNELCSRDVIHFYDHPILAVFLNSIHASPHNPRLLKIRVSNPVAHDGLKGGCKYAQAIEELPLPELSTEKRIEIAIRLSQKTLKRHQVKIPAWEKWAMDWLTGKHTYAGARVAARAADATADATADAAARVAARTAAYAAYAAYAVYAVYAVYRATADAADHADSAADAADSAAARAAALAADHAAGAADAACVANDLKRVLKIMGLW